MFGTIFGDVVGSRFEFNNINYKNFHLYSDGCSFTDDSVCTMAVIEWLLRHERTPESFVGVLKKWVQMYPNKGYGGRFSSWALSSKDEPYNSFGNGAAMRIAPVAYVAKDLEELESLTNMVTGVTHNHPEGLKGALCVATCIYMALHGSSKNDIRKYAISVYPRIAKLDYYDLVLNYEFDETCQGSVPEAIYCFLLSNNIEDCARTAVSIGGDSDTIAAISCSIAEAYFGFSEYDINRLLRYITPDMFNFLRLFYNTYVYSELDSIKLQRYIVANNKYFDQALKEIKNGKKESHWMWFIFPQLKGLGTSEKSEYYGLDGLQHIFNYSYNLTLMDNLNTLCKVLKNHQESNIYNIFGSDSKKLKSCMTAFYLVTGQDVFKAVLDKYFEGKLDDDTRISLVYSARW